MTHKADAIILAVADAMRQHTDTPINVFEHRALTLADHQDELPAISVDFGEDAPFDADGSTGFDFNQSILTVNVTIVVSDTDERDVREDLLNFRKEVHKAIMYRDLRDLAGVISVNYGGAEAPEIIAEGDAFLGALVCIWGVMYQTPIDNPE